MDDKIRLADLLKIHFGVELDPQDGKSSRKRETACFCSRYNTYPPRQEAELPIKIKHSAETSSKIDASFA